MNTVPGVTPESSRSPERIHWFARLLALLLALLGTGMMVFALWALIFDPKGNVLELIGIVPVGLLVAGVCGWIAMLGRAGPRIDMDLDAPAPRLPALVRIWAGVICLLSPILLWLLIHQQTFNVHSWYAWFNDAATAICGGYVFLVLARMCIGGYWPESTLRFARRANMTWRQQLAETRREHDHGRDF